MSVNRANAVFRTLVMSSICLSGAGQGIAQNRVLEHDRFHESLRTDAPVAGEVFRGLLSLPEAQAVRLDDLNVVLPPGQEARLCLVVETQDARYYAEVEYPLKARDGKERVFPRFPTRHGRVLGRYPIREISVLAMVASNCSGVPGVHLPVRWDRGEAVTGEYRAWVSVSAPGIDVRLYDRRSRKYYSCGRPAASERLVAFDRECHLDRGMPEGFLEIVVVRNHFEHRLKDVVIRAYLP